MARSLIIALTGIFQAISLISAASAADKKEAVKLYTLGIMQIVEHPSLNELRRGALDALKKRGLSDNTDIEYMNAQGNMGTNAQIARKLLGKKPDAILAIGTPAAQAALNKNRQTAVVFAPVSDPLAARLVASWDKPGGLATGSSDRSPVLQQLELIRTISPGVKRVAILYNPGEANSQAVTEQFRQACQKLQLAYEEGSVQSSSMVFSVASSVRADAIYVPTDNTVVSAIEAVIKAGVARKIPVFTAESESVRKGALAALAVDYYQLGLTTGEMLADILEKKSSPAVMPVRFQETFQLHINPRHAEAMGVQIPADLLRKAILHH
ncbi:MAG: ABC transporter substrate-binding protein [Deltaproteobacteria bacterium]|nr:ABC transporter substrate-binding protein [Deltaproteobacteria bacterium]